MKNQIWLSHLIIWTGVAIIGLLSWQLHWTGGPIAFGLGALTFFMATVVRGQLQKPFRGPSTGTIVIRIGKDPRCDLQVPDTDEYASKDHAVVLYREGRLYVRDLGSTNGTRTRNTNGSRPNRIEFPVRWESLISQGWEVGVGRTWFTYDQIIGALQAKSSVRLNLGKN
jgi:hypothetical protein